MLRRCTATLGLLTVALILGVGPAPASAASIVSELATNSSGQIVPYGTAGSTDQIVPNGTAGATRFAYYQLINVSPTAIPATGPDSGLAIGVVPANSVQPVNDATSPLAVVNGSFGFEPKNVQVFLSPSDPAPQILGLVFGGSGLSVGGTLNFKVSLDPSYTSLTAPPLSTILPPGGDSSMILPTLSSYTPLVADGAPPAVAANTPEPVSLALWSALAAAGFLRARVFRKAGRNAANLG